MGTYETALAQLNNLRTLLSDCSTDERCAIQARLAEIGGGPNEQRSREAWERLRRAVLEHEPLPLIDGGHSDICFDPSAAVDTFPTWDRRRLVDQSAKVPICSVDDIEAVRDVLAGRAEPDGRRAVLLWDASGRCHHCGEQTVYRFDGSSFAAERTCPVPEAAPHFVIEVGTEKPAIVLGTNKLAMVIPNFRDYQDTLSKQSGLKSVFTGLTRAEKRLYAQHYFEMRRLVILTGEGVPSLLFREGTADAPSFTVQSGTNKASQWMPSRPEGPWPLNGGCYEGLMIAAEDACATSFGPSYFREATRIPVPPGRYRVTVDALARKQAFGPDGRRFITITPEP